MNKAAFKMSEEYLGANTLFTNICKVVESQKDYLHFDQHLQNEIESCLKRVASVVAPNGVFQIALQSCFGVLSDTANKGDNPSKLRLAMVFAAISATMNAFALGATLRTFILLEGSGWKPANTAEMPSIDIFQPSEVLGWVFTTVSCESKSRA